jgi:hypothetical protein
MISRPYSDRQSSRIVNRTDRPPCEVAHVSLRLQMGGMEKLLVAFAGTRSI